MVKPDDQIILDPPYWYVRNPKTSDMLEAITTGPRIVPIFDDHTEAKNAAHELGNDFAAVEIQDMNAMLLFMEFLRKDGCDSVGFRNGQKYRCFAVSAVILAIELSIGGKE